MKKLNARKHGVIFMKEYYTQPLSILLLNKLTLPEATNIIRKSEHKAGGSHLAPQISPSRPPPTLKAHRPFAKARNQGGGSCPKRKRYEPDWWFTNGKISTDEA